MLETFIGKTETNEDITANNNINKVCSELQNAQRVGKKKDNKRVSGGKSRSSCFAVLLYPFQASGLFF